MRLKGPCGNAKKAAEGIFNPLSGQDHAGNLTEQFVAQLQAFPSSAFCQREHLRREQIADHLCGNPRPVRHMARGAVVTGNQPPEAAILENRNRYLGAHPHVFKVFDVNGRDAAEN